MSGPFLASVLYRITSFQAFYAVEKQRPGIAASPTSHGSRRSMFHLRRVRYQGKPIILEDLLDPSTAPTRYTKTLFIGRPHIISTASARAGGGRFLVLLQVSALLPSNSSYYSQSVCMVSLVCLFGVCVRTKLGSVPRQAPLFKRLESRGGCFSAYTAGYRLGCHGTPDHHAYQSAKIYKYRFTNHYLACVGVDANVK